MGKQVRVVLKEKDQYQRWVGRGFLPDGRDLSLEMVKAGMAWHFKKYSADAALSSAEEEARSNKRGLWQMPDPMAPWDFRKSKRKKNG
jgi:endonuclease YncB( thermonuclease family)